MQFHGLCQAGYGTYFAFTVSIRKLIKFILDVICENITMDSNDITSYTVAYIIYMILHSKLPMVRNARLLVTSRKLPSGLQSDEKASCSVFYPSKHVSINALFLKNALFSESAMNSETHSASEENMRSPLNILTCY